MRAIGAPRDERPQHEMIAAEILPRLGSSWAGGRTPPMADLTGGQLAAKLLRPDQRVLLVSGDGAFGLNGMELETAVRFKLPFTCVIGNDGGGGQIRSPQVPFFGEGGTVAPSLPTPRSHRMCQAPPAPGA